MKLMLRFKIPTKFISGEDKFYYKLEQSLPFVKNIYINEEIV